MQPQFGRIDRFVDVRDGAFDGLRLGANRKIVNGSNHTPHKPSWSPDGKELFYVPRLGGFEAASVTMQPAFAFGNAATVSRPFQPGAPSLRRLYDVLPDGRFVGLVTVGQSDPIYTAPHIQVILNWFEEVKQVQ